MEGIGKDRHAEIRDGGFREEKAACKVQMVLAAVWVLPLLFMLVFNYCSLSSIVFQKFIPAKGLFERI